MFSIISLNPSARSKFELHAGKVAAVSTILALITGLFIYNLMNGPSSFLPTSPPAGYIVSGLTLLFLIDTIRYTLLFYKKSKLPAPQPSIIDAQSDKSTKALTVAEDTVIAVAGEKPITLNVKGKELSFQQLVEEHYAGKVFPSHELIFTYNWRVCMTLDDKMIVAPLWHTNANGEFLMCQFIPKKAHYTEKEIFLLKTLLILPTGARGNTESPELICSIVSQLDPNAEGSSDLAFELMNTIDHDFVRYRSKIVHKALQVHPSIHERLRSEGHGWFFEPQRDYRDYNTHLPVY